MQRGSTASFDIEAEKMMPSSNNFASFRFEPLSEEAIAEIIKAEISVDCLGGVEAS